MNNKSKLPQTSVENPELLEKVPSILELRKKGWKVHTTHQRLYVNPKLGVYPQLLTKAQARFLNKTDNPPGEVFPCAGMTTVELFDGSKYYSGVSQCTISDNFYRRKVVKIAIYKALGNDKI